MLTGHALLLYWLSSHETAAGKAEAKHPIAYLHCCDDMLCLCASSMHLTRYGPFRGIGVRIEDDVLLVEGGAGCEVLSKGVPTDPTEVEQLVGARALHPALG